MSEDIDETVNSETLSSPNAHFPISLHNDDFKLNSDDVAKTSKKRAFERILTHLRTPNIDGERAIPVTTIDFDDHCKKRNNLSEGAPKWTPEEANLPLCTNLTAPPTTSAALYDMFFRTAAEHVTPFLNHHIALSSKHPQV
jgi:hypothetical protein